MTRRSDVRITIGALKYYVPMFQLGDEAERKLLEEGSEMSPSERNHYETLAKLKNLATEKIADLSGPLITREINKIISTSHLKNRGEDLFNILYYAGIDGMKRGLRKFDVDKINSSSTNYLFQWIVTYAKKELIVLEAPFGVRPSRFQRYKKISAVRKNLSEKLGREATNEEIFNYFQSGQADLKNLNGKVKDHNKPSQSNLNISLDLIIEQDSFEKEMLNINLIDPLDNYSVDVQLPDREENIFEETVFGAFCESYHVSDEAKAVIMSDLSINNISSYYTDIISSMDAKYYKKLSNEWKNLIKDINGPFYQFLKDNIGNDFAEFDIVSTIKSIESNNFMVKPVSYKDLFITNTKKN